MRLSDANPYQLWQCPNPGVLLSLGSTGLLTRRLPSHVLDVIVGDVRVGAIGAAP
jgi:hypothetical protein